MTVGLYDPWDRGTSLDAPVSFDDLPYVDVASYAANGSGSLADPWTGWDTGIVWAASTHYHFRAGYFSYATAPAWGLLSGLKISGAGKATVLVYTGTGNAISVDSGAVNGVGFTYFVDFSDFLIKGNAAATNGIYWRSVHYGRIHNVGVIDVAADAFRGDFIVGNEFSLFRCSMKDTFTTTPAVGMRFEKRGAAEVSTANHILVPNIEGLVGGVGIKLVEAVANIIDGGFAQACATGIEIGANCSDNRLHGTDVESNTSRGITVLGDRNELRGVVMADVLYFENGATENMVNGGRFNAITIDVGANRTRLRDVNYGNAGGALTDLGTSTEYESVRNLTGGAYLINRKNAPTVGPSSSDVAVVNGANNGITIPTGVNHIRLTGASAAFQINGIVATSIPDGFDLYIDNATGQAGTLTYESGLAAGADRLRMGDGTNRTLQNQGCVHLKRFSTNSRWSVISVI